MTELLTNPLIEYSENVNNLTEKNFEGFERSEFKNLSEN